MSTFGGQKHVEGGDRFNYRSIPVNGEEEGRLWTPQDCFHHHVKLSGPAFLPTTVTKQKPVLVNSWWETPECQSADSGMPGILSKKPIIVCLWLWPALTPPCCSILLTAITAM